MERDGALDSQTVHIWTEVTVTFTAVIKILYTGSVVSANCEDLRT
jgi:hypothetical protein